MKVLKDWPTLKNMSPSSLIEVEHFNTKCVNLHSSMWTESIVLALVLKQ